MSIFFNISRSVPYYLVLLCSILTSPEILARESIVLSGIFKDKAALEINGKRRILSKDSVSPEGLRLLSTHKDYVVIEYKDELQKIYLESQFGGNYDPPQDETTVTIAPDSQNMYLVNGSINGFQVRFVVDTGATFISMNKNVAKRIGLQYRLIGKKSLSDTASGVSNIYIVTLERVKVGDIEIKNVKAAVHEGDYPLLILLGNSFLSQVSMKRDGQLMQLSR